MSKKFWTRSGSALVTDFEPNRSRRPCGRPLIEDNKRFAARNTKDPSLLQGICACSSCGYAYYRTSTRITNKKIYYYRCLGSDDYRYEHGRVCANKPVRADYLDTVVWDHITALLTDPALIRTEINNRLEQVRTADPATVQHQRLDAGLATAITRLVGAFQEQLISLDELRSRMPELRARETSLRHQINALDEVGGVAPNGLDSGDRRGAASVDHANPGALADEGVGDGASGGASAEHDMRPGGHDCTALGTNAPTTTLCRNATVIAP
jgi:hypothetical protein